MIIKVFEDWLFNKLCQGIVSQLIISYPYQSKIKLYINSIIKLKHGVE